MRSNKEETSRFRRSVRNKQKINRSETGESEGVQDRMKEEREGEDSQEDHEDQEDQEDQYSQKDQDGQEDQEELVIEPISVDGDKYSINSFGINTNFYF